MHITINNDNISLPVRSQSHYYLNELSYLLMHDSKSIVILLGKSLIKLDNILIKKLYLI